MFSRFKKLLLIGLFLPVLVFAYQSPGTPHGFVNDFAGLFNAEQRVNLEAKLSAFENDTRNEIAVVTVKNLGGDTVENFAVALFKEWGIGKKGKDNGVLLLVAADDHKMRIEVGYGLEPSLTDAQTNIIIRNTLTPSFRANDFYGGVARAVNQMIAAVSPEYAAVAGIKVEPIRESRSAGKFDFSSIIFFIFFVPLWLASILGRSKSWWAGGVIGGIVGIIIAIFYGFLYAGLLAMVFFVPLGLLFDFIVSRAYGKSKASGRRPPWWIGGGGIGRGGGGFGGFGGGGSGGGGSSGSW